MTEQGAFAIGKRRRFWVWSEIKAAVTQAMLACGGTTTHHHAVGRDFRTYYERERPDGYARALAAVKRPLDPRGILNPGVLLSERLVAEGKQR
jgi:alkyldihydroxyacetonephosphate synthase